MYLLTGASFQQELGIIGAVHDAVTSPQRCRSGACIDLEHVCDRPESGFFVGRRIVAQHLCKSCTAMSVDHPALLRIDVFWMYNVFDSRRFVTGTFYDTEYTSHTLRASPRLRVREPL